MDKQNNRRSNKGLMVALVVFAVIGLVSVVYLGIKCTMSLINKADNPEEVAVIEISESDLGAEKVEKLTSETLEESSTENSDATATEDENPADMTQMADVNIPKVQASNNRDDATHEDGKMNMVFLGDSMLDNFRDSTGIAYLVGTAFDANIYNLGVGGMAASCSRTTSGFGDDQFTDFCGITIAKIIAGRIDVNVLPDCTAKTILTQHIDEVRAADVIFVEYGINDFLSGREQNNPDDGKDYRTYQGALMSIFDSLKEACPNAKIVMCAPSYVEFYRDNGEYIGNSITLNNGLGSEEDFGRKAEYVAGQYENIWFYPLADQGISMENSYETMLDDVHLNEKGRAIYSDNLIKFIENNEIAVRVN